MLFSAYKSFLTKFASYKQLKNTTIPLKEHYRHLNQLKYLKKLAKKYFFKTIEAFRKRKNVNLSSNICYLNYPFLNPKTCL
jgi:hypothetical protein